MKSLVIIMFFIGISMVIIGYNRSIINNQEPKIEYVEKSMLDQQFSTENIFKSKNLLFDNFDKLSRVAEIKNENVLPNYNLNSVGKNVYLDKINNIDKLDDELRKINNEKDKETDE